MPAAQLAEFLNDTTGKDAEATRIISEEVENGLLSTFSDKIQMDNEQGKYQYIGAETVNGFSSSYQEVIKQHKEQQQLLDSVNNVGQTNQRGSFDKEQAQAVLQHEVAITTADSEKPILGTFGADQCIIVALYNAQLQSAALAHVDSLTDLSSLSKYFNQLSSEDTTIEVHLSGGQGNKDKATEVIDFVKNYPNADIKSAKVCNPEASQSLAIDSRSGKTFTWFSVNQLQYPEDYKSRLLSVGMQMGRSPLKETFNSTRSVSIVNNNIHNEVDHADDESRQDEKNCVIQ